MNVVAIWLYLIGTPQRARKLRGLIDKTQSADGTEPSICPTRILFGEHESHRIYAKPELRPALDAWDIGEISKRDIKQFCLWIESGKYHGRRYVETPVGLRRQPVAA